MSEKNEKSESKFVPMSAAERYSLHETVALKIFMEEISLVPIRGGVHQAQRAFNFARGFVEVAESVRSGDYLPVDPVDEKPKMKKIRTPDPVTGEMIEYEVQEDYACCPNLPADHPFNQAAREYTGPINATIGS